MWRKLVGHNDDAHNGWLSPFTLSVFYRMA
jgi:hypothetical protein